jgi:tetratricopeptide (TPR) repeat protein
MSTRFRKSIGLGKGVRMTVGKRGVSASVGIPGFRVTAHSSGRITRSVGIPGTGITNVSRVGAGGRSRSRETGQSSSMPANYTIPKPGFLASRAEKRYFATVLDYLQGRNEDVVRHATEALDGDGSLTSAHLLAALAIARMEGDHGAIRAHLEAVLTSDHPMPDRWQSKYLPAVAINAKITEQIVAEVPFDAVGAALVLAELYQLDGRLDDAIGLVQQLHANASDDPLIRLSLCDLLVADADYDGALEASAGAVNDGDIGVATLHLRGAALYGQGQPGAAAEAFTAALAKTANRDLDLLNVGRYDRALAYTDAGQARRARGDLEKLAAADPTFLDVQDRLAALA